MRALDAPWTLVLPCWGMGLLDGRLRLPCESITSRLLKEAPGPEGVGVKGRAARDSRGTDGMGAVELKPEAPARDGIQDEQRSHAAAERLNHAEVPLEQIDVQPGALLRQP